MFSRIQSENQKASVPIQWEYSGSIPQRGMELLLEINNR